MSQSTTLTGGKTVTHKSIHVTAPEKVKSESFSGIKWLDNLVGEYKFNRYGIYVVALLLIGVLAGAAVGLGAMSHAFSIAILVVPTMAALVMILAIAPMRALLWTVLIACVVDIIVIVYYVLV